MVECFTRGVVNFNRSDNFREAGSFRVDISGRFSNLEGGLEERDGVLSSLYVLSVKRTSAGAEGDFPYFNGNRHKRKMF